MASHEQMAATTSQTQPNNVSIRVIALAHATNQNEDIYLVINLDTTILQLKERLQQELSHHPQPGSQRLIYQGRPLTDGSATLRQTLRLDSTSANEPPAHVLYLVIRDDQSPQPPATTQPQSEQTPNPTSSAPENAESATISAHQGLAFAQQMLPQGHPAQALLQNALQQHMDMHNQHQNQHNQNLANNPHIPPLPRMPFPIHGSNLPHFPRMQVNQPQQPNTSTSMPGRDIRSNTPNNNVPSLNSLPNTIFQGAMSRNMRIQETIGPNGERIRTVVHNNLPSSANVNPVERSASAPTLPADSTTPTPPSQSTINPGPTPPIFPMMQPPQLGNFQQAFGRLPNFPVNNHIVIPQHPARIPNPLVYLIQSPTGPEALLITPNQGNFSSQPQVSTAQLTNQIQPQGTDIPTQSNQPTQTQPARQNREPARNNDHGQVAIRPAVAEQGRPQVQPARREGEDMVALILQRGWLFLRLYMFIFVLSEPGTWRRYIMLTIASLVCLMPRNNPFTDILQAVRRHFDNLIGPPQPPRRPENRQPNEQPIANEANDTNRGDGPAHSRAQSQQLRNDPQIPTPEEHARRLLREHEERNPSVIRNAFYRIEQGVALFLASLIPGVGERHVRAREEARRVVQEEEERRRRAEEERAQQRTENEKSADEVAGSLQQSDPPAAISSGAEVSSSNAAEDEGIRRRT